MARVDLVSRPGAARPELHVVLSERNLASLLSKLHTPGSRCELRMTACPDGRFAAIRLRAERDGVHYRQSQRERDAGPLHPFTELVVAAVQETLRELEARGSRSPLRIAGA